MEWYYAEGNQQRGPVDEAEFERLAKAGTIRSDTLVWREGFANWQPYSQATAPQPTPSAAGEGSAAGGMMCSQCGRPFPADQVIRYGDVWVCATCKPAFLQRLKEGVAVTSAMEYATFWTRFAAKFIDGIILWIVNTAIGFAMGLGFAGAVRSGGSEAMIVLQVVAYLVGTAITLLYGVFFLGRYGATPGKMACHIKVVTAEGEPISYGRAAGRCLSEILSGLICYIGYIMAGFDEERRALHDRICSTRVIRS